MKARPGLAMSLVGTLLVCFALLVVVRWRALTDPAILGYDESEQLVCAMSWNQGLIPGLDTWDDKPPLIPMIYAASDRVFGHTPLPLRWAELLSILATAMICWHVGRRLGGDAASWPAALVFCLAVTTQMPPAELLPLFTEGFFLLPFTISLAAELALCEQRPTSSRWLMLLSGLSLGTAVLVRQNGLLMVPVSYLFLAANRYWTDGSRLRDLLVDVLVWTLGAVAALAPAVAAFGSLANLRGVGYWAWSFPRQFSTYAVGPYALGAAKYLVRYAALHAVPCAAAAAGLAAVVQTLRATRDTRLRLRLLLLCGFAAASFGMGMLGGRFYLHYTMLWAPAVGILASLGFAWMKRSFTSLEGPAGKDWTRGGRGVAVLVAWTLAVTCVASVRGASPSWGEEDHEQALRGPLLNKARELTRESDPVFVLGSSPGIYYRLGRPPAAPDTSGALLSERYLNVDLTHQAVPTKGGGTKPISQLLSDGIARARLVIELTACPEPRPFRISGERVWWEFDKVPTGRIGPDVKRSLESNFRPLPEPVEGARLWVPKLPLRRPCL